MVYDFSDSKTPQNYWLAKSFILLGDIYMSRGDSFQARATYQSVVDGYSPADDGIVAEARQRIEKLKPEEN
jgi:predicted negative regulator of RcsB-dependent stress response